MMTILNILESWTHSTVCNMLLISIIICFIIDCSGLMHSLKTLLSSIISTKLKISADDIRIPFISCSLCSVFWTNIIYLFITNSFSLPNLTIVCLLALFASNISGLLMTIKDYLAKLESWLQKQLH